MSASEQGSNVRWAMGQAQRESVFDDSESYLMKRRRVVLPQHIEQAEHVSKSSGR